MRRFVFLTLLSTAFALTCPVVGAKDEQDGVQVEKMSPLRNLVSEEKMQAEALQQYTALKAPARGWPASEWPRYSGSIHI
jgi:hypothetical protein